MTQRSTWCLPIKYSPPEWVSTRGHPGGTWHLAVSSQRHSWLCTDEQHRGGWQIKRHKYIFGGLMFFFCGKPCCMRKRLLHFHPAERRWSSSAQTRRRPGLWCRRIPCQSQLCSPLRKTSSPSPLKRCRKSRSLGKRKAPSFLHLEKHTHTHTYSQK